jgi:hypothetical protein
MQIKTRCHYAECPNFRALTIPNVGKDVEQFIVGGNPTCIATLENILVVFQ